MDSSGPLDRADATDASHPAAPPEEGFLEDTWGAYAHGPLDRDWRHCSYRILGAPISDIAGFWLLWNSISDLVTRSMVFVMRDGVHPSWDDPANLDGSIASAIVPMADSPAAFLELVQMALGETLVVDRGTDDAGDSNQTSGRTERSEPPESRGTHMDLNGVSIGPKRGFCVIKVWMRTLETDTSRIRFPPSIDAARVRVRPCRDHMQVRA